MNNDIFYDIIQNIEDPIKWLNENKYEKYVKWLIERRPIFFLKMARKKNLSMYIKAGNKKNIKLLMRLELNEYCRKLMMIKAAKYGNLKLIKWFHKIDFKGCTGSVMEMADYKKEKKIVKWIDKNCQKCFCLSIYMKSLTFKQMEKIRKKLNF